MVPDARVAGRWIVGSVFGVLTLAFGSIAVLTLLSDNSPLAALPDSIRVERDVAYGPEPEHRLDIAYGMDPGSSLHPAIVMIHQGGWMMGDKDVYHELMAHYVLKGYATVSLNFRPSTRARFPAPFQDCRRAVRWLRAHASPYRLDPDRIGVTGWSSGAHLAMLLALSDDPAGEPSSRVQAAVCHAGVYDFLMEARGAFANRADDPAVVRLLGGTPRQKPDLARRASPLHHLTPDDPPLLVLHGERDTRIDVEQARQFRLALEHLGRTDEVIIIPGGNHGGGVLPGTPGLRDKVDRFFNRTLRPGP